VEPIPQKMGLFSQVQSYFGGIFENNWLSKCLVWDSRRVSKSGNFNNLYSENMNVKFGKLFLGFISGFLAIYLLV